MENGYESKIREQMSGPDLHVFTLKLLALKKLLIYSFGVKLFFFHKKGIYASFSADAIVFSNNNKKNFDPKKVKKWVSKLAHKRPKPFCFTVQPRPQPTAQN